MYYTIFMRWIRDNLWLSHNYHNLWSLGRDRLLSNQRLSLPFSISGSKYLWLSRKCFTVLGLMRYLELASNSIPSGLKATALSLGYLCFWIVQQMVHWLMFIVLCPNGIILSMWKLKHCRWRTARLHISPFFCFSLRCGFIFSMEEYLSCYIWYDTRLHFLRFLAL